ncbi:MAG: hypothetical protein F6K14_30915 [Symploca sp. SIO2C1]|nr:hypothetical protein [Symploca sp. SIO2C1]
MSAINKVLEKLPSCYRHDPEQSNIADALTRVSADAIASVEDKLKNYRAYYLDPATAKAEWLDEIARYHGWGNYWDSTWTEDIKRQLLINTEFIFANRGNKDAIAKLFDIFELDAVLQSTSGFILGVTLLSGTLSNSPYDYEISVPANYAPGTPERELILRLTKQFLPCWINLSITQR